MDRFILVWLQYVNPRLDEMALRRLFMKVDARCTGHVSWSDFINFICVGTDFKIYVIGSAI